MMKRGAVDWTVGTLFRLVLAALLIFLVGYGLVNQSFGPLIDNIKYNVGEVNYLMKSFFGDKLGSSCYDRKVSELADGESFLKSVGVSEASLFNCQDGICNVKWGDYEFRKRDGRLEKLEGKIWVGYDFVMSEDLVSVKSDWDKYNGAVDFLESAGTRDVYDSFFTRKFILFGDGNGGNNNVTMVWQSNDWYIQENGKVGVVFDDDKDAIDAFVELVRDGLDDKVYWGYDSSAQSKDIDLSSRKRYSYLPAGEEECSIYCGEGFATNIPIGVSGEGCSSGTIMNMGRCCCSWKDYGFDVVSDGDYLKESVIGDLIGNNDGFLSFYDKLDDDSEVLVLEGKFSETRLELLDEVGLGFEQAVKMKSLVDGKKVNIGEVDYVVSIEEILEDFPRIVFSSSSDKFALEFSAFPIRRGSVFPWVERRYFPASLMKFKNGKWERVVDEEIYRLPEIQFLEIYYGNLAGKFLWEKCR